MLRFIPLILAVAHMNLKGIINGIRDMFRAPATLQKRGYREVTGIGQSNTDWNISVLGEDADIWQNAWLLTSRMRDLFRTNPLYIKYRELIWCNVLGEHGYMLRPQVKETEDRVVYSADEKAALKSHQDRINRVREWAARKNGTEAQRYRAFWLADELEKRDFETVIRGQAMIQVGQPDVYANKLIGEAWKEWQRPEFSDVRQTRTYNTQRQLRLISAIRDGDFFIRMVRMPRINKFGFSLQMINAEWCDRFYNDVLSNGNVVRMGIEYKMNEWGLGKVVAFYFIKRQPMDWQWSNPGTYAYSNANLHERVSADEIIHYARPVDADGTRPAPWASSTIPKARQLDQYELAEVIAAREQACKTGFYYSDIVPEGGIDVPPDPRTGIPTESLAPGEARGLPFGVKYQERNPTHPSGNFDAFRKAMLRSDCAGMPGADYSRLANDYEAINFSAGRLQMLDTNEIYKLLQRFDIDCAEKRIYENWLEMALITGAIPLPLGKLAKFRKYHFQARRWQGIDPQKEIDAAAMRIANKLSSRTRECAEVGIDFKDNAFDLAEEEMFLEELGLSTETTVETALTPKPQEDVTDPKETTAETDAKPAKKNGNGKHHASARK